MPHADSSLVPTEIKTKAEFWAHVHSQLALLLEGQKNWVTNLANASSLVYNALSAFPSHFGSDDKAVNWCGFYLDSRLFPRSSDHNTEANRLLLGPFCGKPACQFINVTPGKSRGVVADGFLQAKTLLVPDVDSYPGHIACDGETKSEIVCPLFLGSKPIGILDLDCLALGGFDQEDKEGLEKIAALVVSSCEWE
ncbi:GAF domain-like protein [Dendrothele bispora CBS 962.96]|uniref:GAF domain-like protein n=1 Tax=Dendrothele bispora (strain CBS 962.96) TaxID=1314807 RepID=A0A4S8M4U9_DENBC|nr:GAF domain-like protein [Dendrothele bispora CBS 962.96]